MEAFIEKRPPPEEVGAEALPDRAQSGRRARPRARPGGEAQARKLKRCGRRLRRGGHLPALGSQSKSPQREAGNYERIVAAGGDGTVHEVVNGLMRTGGKAALGVIPAGQRR